MKRNHIYIGGTVLLALLGACGGYYLWAGPGEEKDKGQAKSDDDAGKGDDDTGLMIDVPPMTSDEPFAVPVMPPANEPPARYGMNPANLDSGSAHTPFPAAGGASPLPAGQDALASDEGNAAEGRADALGQPNLQTGRYGSYKTPPGNPIEGLNVADEIAEPQGAAAEIDDRTDPTRQPGERDPISRGQYNAARTDISDLGNSLRSSARSAFTSDAEVAAIAGDAGGYRDAAAIPENGYGAIGAATQQASPPAPITVADTAEPLYGSSAPALPLANGEQSSPAGTGVVAESSIPSASGGGVGGESGFAAAGESALAADSARSLDANYGGGYSGASDLGSGTIDSTAVGSYGSASAADSYASNTPQQQFSDTNADVPRALNTFGAAGATQNASIATSPFAGGTARQIADGSEGTGRPGGEALEGPQAPQLAVEKSAPAEIQVGKNCTFTIEVKNTGRAEARQVRLVDEVPHGTQLVRTSPNAAVAGSQLEWEFGTLAPGESKSVEVELLPTDEGEIGSVATVHFAAAASVRTHSTRPQLEVVAEVAPTVMIGEQLVVRISLKNPGTGDATGVMLLENVPDGMSHPHGQDLEFEVGTLRAGESRQLELILTAEAKGVFQNRIVAKGDGNLHDEDAAEFEVIAPEIAVSVDGPQRKYLELPATFVVAVENRGTAAAKDIELVGKLPPGLQFVSANNFGEYDEATRSVYWSLAELQPLKRGEVTLVAMPVDLGEQRLEFKAGADLGLVDHAESTLRVEGLAALKSEVTDIADPIEVGGQSSYEIRIVNQGSKAATNVRVIAQFPEGIEAVRAEGPTEGRVEPKLVEFAPLKELSPKADTTYRIEVAGVRPGDQRVLVQIMTDDLAQPINEEESTRVYADQ